MNNKIIGIVIGVLILGVVIFSGINSPELSTPRGLNVPEKIKSTGLTNPEVMGVDDWVDGVEFGPCSPHTSYTIDCRLLDSHEVVQLQCVTSWRSVNFDDGTHWICD